MQEQIDPYLFALSYDYVGDMSETVALLWNNSADHGFTPVSTLTEIINQLNTLSKSGTKDYLRHLLNQLNSTERWALLKLGSSS
jgi:DNA ligase-1